jgi:subtilisin family serine protease
MLSAGGERGSAAGGLGSAAGGGRGIARAGGRVMAAVAVAVLLGLLPVLPAATASADSVRDQQQWVFTMLNVQPAWNVTEGEGVTVAVIDSGVDPNVTDLEGSVHPGPDYTGLHTSPGNASWGEHGTWMASIIAGHGHDGGFDGVGYDGIVGIAPKSSILSIRVIPDKGDPGYQAYNNEPEQQIQDELAKGIMTAVKDGAKVISMSIGYSAPSGVVRAAIQDAYSHGVVLVASSGNSGDNDTQHATSGSSGMAPVSFPAEYPGVISVGAVTQQKTATSFSSGNLSVRIAAPGKTVPAEGRNGLYYTVDGTSPACALVAGVAALIESRYKGISPAQVTQALTSTAEHPKGGYDVLTGFGIVNAGAALTAAGQLMAQKPAGSQVALSTHFGGGAAAVPAAPVVPRGTGGLVTFALLALTAAAAIGGGAVWLARTRERGRRRRDGHHAA